MNAFDISVYQAVNGLAGRFFWLDAILGFISHYAMIIYGVLFILFWFALPRSKPASRNALIVAVFAGILALIINTIISLFWARPRPFVSLEDGTFNQLIPHDADASFPSNHTSGSFGIASAVWGTNKWVSRTLTIFAIIVLFSRVYSGVHWPTDVLAGVIVGTIAGLSMKRFSRYFIPLTDLGMKMFGLQPREGTRKTGRP